MRKMTNTREREYTTQIRQLGIQPMHGHRVKQQHTARAEPHERQKQRTGRNWTRSVTPFQKSPSLTPPPPPAAPLGMAPPFR